MDSGSQVRRDPSILATKSCTHRSCMHPLHPRGSLPGDITWVAPWLPQRPQSRGRGRGLGLRLPESYSNRVPRAERPGCPGKEPGAPGARVELPAAPEEGCLDESCQGNLSNSNTGASLLHNSRAAADGGGGRSPAPAGSPHPYLGVWRVGVGHPAGAPCDPRPPGASCCRGNSAQSQHWAESERERAQGISRDREIRARVPAQRAPWRPCGGSSSGLCWPRSPGNRRSTGQEIPARNRG